MTKLRASTMSRRPPDIAGGVSLETFALVRRAIQNREQLWSCCGGQALRFCPHALGWRGDAAYVLGLVLRERREPAADGATWEWLMEWRWIRLADLEIPSARRGDWIASPREQRPRATEFLTRVYLEAE